MPLKGGIVVVALDIGSCLRVDVVGKKLSNIVLDN